MGKTIITGPEMKNFRQAFDALLKGDGVLSIHADGELVAAVESLAGDAEKRRILGEKAKAAVCRHAGALEKTIKLLEENRSCQLDSALLAERGKDYRTDEARRRERGAQRGIYPRESRRRADRHSGEHQS